MASAQDPGEVFRSTTGRANFHRVTRLLISGGTVLLREIFDLIYPPSCLPTVLKNPATENQVRSAKLSKPQWDCLYPSPGVYGKSTDFDVTLLFRLLRTICNLTPPVLGWDALPVSADRSLPDDLARIKYYRNSIYGDVNQNMEITDDAFPFIWREISGALVRVAGHISPAKEMEWQKAIDNFLTNPLTAEDERNIQELVKWYENDTEVKKSVMELKSATQEGMERLEISLKGIQEVLKVEASSVTENVKRIGGAVREETQCLGEQLATEMKDTTQAVQQRIGALETRLKASHEGLEYKTHSMETTVREEAQDIKDQLGTVQQSIDRLSSSAEGSQAGGRGARIQLRINCEAISGPGLQGQSHEVAIASQKSEGETQGAGENPVVFFQQQSTAPRGFGGEEGIPSAQGVLNFIAFKYFQTVDPSKPEELNGYLQYLREVRQVLFVDAQTGSLIITVECNSLEILEGLWNDYSTGHLNEMAQKFLVTDDVLKDFGLIEVKLTTNISEKEYRACREHFMLPSEPGWEVIPHEVSSAVTKTSSLMNGAGEFSQKTSSSERSLSQSTMASSSPSSTSGYLHNLCRQGNTSAIRPYLQGISDINKLEERVGFLGYTPLHEATNRGQTSVVRLLLLYGANANAKANGFYTPLHIAASMDNLDCVMELLKHNADITSKDEFGKTPYDTAMIHRCKKTARILKSEGQRLKCKKGNLQLAILMGLNKFIDK